MCLSDEAAAELVSHPENKIMCGTCAASVAETEPDDGAEDQAADTLS